MLQYPASACPRRSPIHPQSSPALPLLLAAATLAPTPVWRRPTPAVGATVASPNEIRLFFSEGVEPRFSGVTLTAANGSTAPLGSPRAEGAGRDILVVPVAKPLSPGVYTVHWHAVSVDTHRTQGTFQFTVK